MRVVNLPTLDVILHKTYSYIVEAQRRVISWSVLLPSDGTAPAAGNLLTPPLSEIRSMLDASIGTAPARCNKAMYVSVAVGS